MATEKEIQFLVNNGSVYWDGGGLVYLYHPLISKNVFRMTEKRFNRKIYEDVEEIVIDNIPNGEQEHIQDLINKSKFDVKP